MIENLDDLKYKGALANLVGGDVDDEISLFT